MLELENKCHWTELRQSKPTNGNVNTGKDNFVLELHKLYKKQTSQMVCKKMSTGLRRDKQCKIFWQTRYCTMEH